jgi:hypothetical protein
MSSILGDHQQGSSKQMPYTRKIASLTRLLKAHLHLSLQRYARLVKFLD